MLHVHGTALRNVVGGLIKKIAVYDNNTPSTLMGAGGEALPGVNRLARGTRVPRIRVLSVTWKSIFLLRDRVQNANFYHVNYFTTNACQMPIS